MVIVVSNWRGEYETVFSRFPQVAGDKFPFLPPPHPNHGAHPNYGTRPAHLARAAPAWATSAAPVVDVRSFFPCFISTILETELSGKHSDCGIRANDP